MKKLIPTFFVTLNFFNLAVFCQSEFGEEQIIQSTIDQDKITMQVLDFDTDEPLIGATIYSRDLNDTLATTDINGNASFEKHISRNFQISYVGYEYLCFQINDSSVDNVIIRLKSDLVIIDLYVISPEADSLKKALHKAGRFDAENDLNAGNIKLLYKIEPTEEQKTFANNYSFTFVNGESKSIDYRQTYNGVVLDFLSDKFSINIRKELKAMCWTNSK